MIRSDSKGHWNAYGKTKAKPFTLFFFIKFTKQQMLLFQMKLKKNLQMENYLSMLMKNGELKPREIFFSF